MKTKWKLLIAALIALALILMPALLLAADTNAPAGVPGGTPTAAGSLKGLLLLLIPILVPLLVAIGKWVVPKVPSWILPILAPALGALIDYLTSLATGRASDPLVGAVLGSAGVGLRELADQVKWRITAGPPAPPAAPLILMLALGWGTGGCAWLHPEKIPLAPVAAGQDVVVVNAERIQASSLAIYQQTIEWEMANRTALPVTVSRAVDRLRAEFPDAYHQSERVLADYKAARGPTATVVNQITAALSATQSAMLRLRSDQGQIVQLFAALNQLTQSVIALSTGTPAPAAP